MPRSMTVMGKPFVYTGSLTDGLTIHFESSNSKMKIPPEIIRIVREEISRRSPVLMGANRDPLVKDSVGETLSLTYGRTPQIMSYVLPLLVEEGFCSVNHKKPFVIRRR